MGFDEVVEKSRKAINEGLSKVEDARRSERAGKVRDGAVSGFEKLMYAILPGEGVQGEIQSAQQHVDEAVNPEHK